MRKFKFTLIAFMAAMMALSFTACSDDDPEPNPNPDPEVNEDNYHFDLFVTVDKHGGMSSKNTTIVHSVNSLAAEQGVITVKREGSELGDYSMETISKGKYYYQIPATKSRTMQFRLLQNVPSRPTAIRCVPTHMPGLTTIHSSSCLPMAGKTK